MKLYVLGTNTDDKGKQLEILTAAILKKQGYTNISTNVVSTGGSEVDAGANLIHRLGVDDINYPVICECKAHNKPITTNDWLKFIGKIYLEKLKNEHTIGLMIALSGANGNVIGSYNEVKKYKFIHLIANDDLINLLSEEYSLSKLNEIEKYIKQYTDKGILEIDLAYYSKCVYWIVGFIDGGFTVIRHDIKPTEKKDLEILLPLLNDNTSYIDYIDIEAEYIAITRRTVIDKLILSILIESSKGLSIDEIIQTMHSIQNTNYQTNKEELSGILNTNKFIDLYRNKYKLKNKDNINFIDFYQYVLTGAIPIRILSRKLFLEKINEELLEQICEIQNGIKIPSEKKKECLFLLKYSSTALGYAIHPDDAITRFRSSNGSTISSNVDEGHTELFFHNIINSFIQDYHNQMLSELYFHDYKIFSVNIDVALTISKENEDTICINDNRKMMLAKLGEEYNNQIILLSKLPENK